MRSIRCVVVLGLGLVSGSGSVACDDEARDVQPPADAPKVAAPVCPEPSAPRAPLAQRLGERVEKVAEACKAAEPLARDPARDAEVTGVWTGEYQYEDGRASNAIEVALRVREGGLTGDMTEPNTYAGYPARAESTITGDVYASGQVVFLKTYASGGQTHSVLYTGALGDGGRRIEGRWRVDGASGPFWLAKD